MAFLAAALLACCWALTVQGEISPYEARYSVYRNGKLSGTVDVSLEMGEQRWSIESLGHGTHGLARTLLASDHERVSGSIVEGAFRPDQYIRRTTISGIDRSWAAAFDWEALVLRIADGGEEILQIGLPERALDPLSLKLEMRRRLAHPDPDLRFLMVEEDEIEEQTFRIMETEWLETSLGCLETVPVEKIRANSKRYTRAWHAPALGHTEVRMEHGKIGGNHLEMRIAELEIEGRATPPGPGCAAVQGAADRGYVPDQVGERAGNG